MIDNEETLAKFGLFSRTSWVFTQLVFILH